MLLDACPQAAPSWVDTHVGGRVDVLVNNAGVIESTLQPWWAMRPDEARSILNVNTIGPVLVTAALLPALRAGQRKLVANMSSRCEYYVRGGDQCVCIVRLLAQMWYLLVGCNSVIQQVR